VPLDESQTNLTIPKKSPRTPKSGARHRKPDPPPADPDDSTYAPTWKRASYSPHTKPGAPYLDSEMWASRAGATALPPLQQPSPSEHTNPNTASLQDLLTLQQTLRNPICEDCFAGSNDWVVS